MMARRHGGWALAYSLLLASCASSAANREPSAGASKVSESPTYLPHCDVKHDWLKIAPHTTPDSVYGVGSAKTAESALNVARTEAAKSISVEVTEEMTDTQVLWLEQSKHDKRETSQESISRAARSSVGRRLEGCQVQDKCSERDTIHVLVACPRRSGLERALIGAANRLIAARASVGAVLGVPGSDDKGYVTQLGLYALNVIRDVVAASGKAGYTIVSAGRWEPADLHEVARKAKATHLLRVEYLLLESPRTRFSVYLQEVETDRRVKGADAAFEVDLDPGQLVLLSIVGPLLPQKAAQDLINTSGDYPVPMRLSKTELSEGETVSIELTMPRDGFVYIYDIYEDGRADLLMPSHLSPKNRFTAQTVVRVPDASWKKAGAELRACPLKRQELTREYVKVIVTPLPLDLEATSDDTASPDIAALQVKLEELKSAGVPLGTAEMPYVIRAATQPAPQCQNPQE